MTDTRDVRGDDYFDSRDVIARIELLSELRQPGPIDLGDDELNETDQDSLFEELAQLEAFAEEARQYIVDFEHGETFIRDSYFKEYAQELADDIGAIDPDAGWPIGYIDWDAASDALKTDYTSLELDGVTYWAR